MFSLRKEWPQALLERLWQAGLAFVVARDTVRDEFGWAREHRLPLGTRLRLWQRGFTSDKYLMYGLAPDTDLEPYLDDLRHKLRTGSINEPFTPVLGDKLFTWSLLRAITPRMAPLTGLLHAGFYHGLDPAYGPSGRLADRLPALRGDFIVKPQFGALGSGVFRLEIDDAEARINGDPCAHEHLAPLLGPLFDSAVSLLCPYVQQAEYARRIHAGSANTLRFLTLYDDRTDEVIVATVVQRFGRAGSHAVDNVQGGGITAPVDLATGRIGRAVGTPVQGVRPSFSHHPDSGVPIEGVVIPRWHWLVDEMKALARRLTFLPYIGWDVVLTDDDFVIIEGNSRTGVVALQAHGPLLADPKVRDWYRYKGVIER